MPGDGVHVSRICVHILDIDRNGLIVCIYDFKTVHTHVEKISPTLGDIQLDYSALDALLFGSRRLRFLLYLRLEVI
jgi:hypothetical protein